MMSELQQGQVTIADLFQVLSRIQTDLAKALTRIEVIDSRNGDADNLHRDHETRLRSLEAFKWKLTGIALCVAVVFGLLSGYLTTVLSKR